MIRIIDIPIYRCSVVFLIGASREEWGAFFEENKKKGALTERDNIDVIDEYDNEQCLGFVVETEGKDCITCIKDKNNPGVVAHEIFHAANAILHGRGVEPGNASEPWAYLIEYITNEFYSIPEE